MATKAPDDPSFGQETSNRKVLLIAAVVVVGFIFLFNDIVGWIGGGGLFSIISAIRAVGAKAEAIDVDESGLRTLAMVAFSIPVIAICYRLNVNIERRGITASVFLGIFGGAFAVDSAYGEPTITSYMLAHGYSRCHAGDHVEGHGKSRVWFANYVRNRSDCWIDQLGELARALPKQTGKFTRLDYISTGQLYITFAYTLTDASGVPLDNLSAKDLAQRSDYLNGGLRAQVCANRKHNPLSRGLIENFRYAGESGLVRMVTVRPESCPRA